MSGAWIVILNWNGKEDTLELLASLERADLPDTTVLVVDNGSTDGSLEAVRETFPWVLTLQTGRNLGYAGGNNRGVDLALEAGAEVIGVLNNDTVVTEAFWPPLVAEARRPLTAVSPDIRYAVDPDVSWFYGGAVAARDGYPYHLAPNEQPSREGVTSTQTLSGCCLVANAATWRLVGGFDEGLYLIFEDTDWCLRARGLGVELLLQPASTILHKVSRSIDGPASGLGAFYFSRNGVVVVRRWFGGTTAARFASRRVFAIALRDLRRNGTVAIRPLLIRSLGVAAGMTRRLGAAGTLIRSIAGRHGDTGGKDLLAR